MIRLSTNYTESNPEVTVHLQFILDFAEEVFMFG